MDKFTITGYSKATDVVTVTFVLQAKTGFAGGTFTGVKITGLPKDSIASVKAFLRSYTDAFVRGKQSEDSAQSDISTEVKTLLNVEQDF